MEKKNFITLLLGSVGGFYLQLVCACVYFQNGICLTQVLNVVVLV